MKSIKTLEMQNHISELISIDNFQAKLGNDEDVSVIQLTTDNKSVAEDLVSYIESGHKSVLDADFSPSKNEQKRYSVFIELERNDSLPNTILEIIRDIENVSGMLPWKFKFYKQDKFYSLSEENLQNIIPTSSSQYTLLTDENLEQDIKEFFESESIISKRLNGKTLTLKKTFTSHLMILESFNKDVKGTYKIDRESNEQSSYINHWLGGKYSVVKVDDLFKITKGKKSLVAKVKDF